REPNGGLVLPPDGTTSSHRDLIVALAARHRLPAVYSVRSFVEGGGLMSYGADQADMFRQAAGSVDRILRGADTRELRALGHEVRLMPAQYVKAYIKRNKHDAADAEAICEAVGRPTMRFVPIKTADQQAAVLL